MLMRRNKAEKSVQAFRTLPGCTVARMHTMTATLRSWVYGCVYLPFSSFLYFTFTQCLFTYFFLSSVKLSNVVIEKSTVALVPEHGLKIRTDHVSGSMTSKWHYKQNSW